MLVSGNNLMEFIVGAAVGVFLLLTVFVAVLIIYGGLTYARHNKIKIEGWVQEEKEAKEDVMVSGVEP